MNVIVSQCYARFPSEHLLASIHSVLASEQNISISHSLALRKFRFH